MGYGITGIWVATVCAIACFGTIQASETEPAITTQTEVAEEDIECMTGYSEPEWLTRNEKGMLIIKPIPLGGKPIPNGPDVKTQKDYDLRYFAWLNRHVTAYLKATPLPESAPLERVHTFIMETARRGCNLPGAKPWPELMKEADALQETDAKNHPLFFCFRIECLLWNDRKIDIIPALNSIEKLKPRWQSLPSIIRYLILERVDNNTVRDDCHLGVAWTALLEANAQKAFTADEQDIFIRKQLYLFNRLNLETFPVPRMYMTAIQADEWTYQMWQGMIEVERAWAARGGGWASSVGEKGWDNWGKSMEKAYGHFSKAYELRPDRPEAAARQIVVLCGYQPENAKENQRTWFDRSVAAQMDYKRAYDDYLFFVLEPRWGGNAGMLKAFAIECLDTNRFDTNLPLKYFSLIRELSKKANFRDWQIPFQDPEEHVRLERFIAGLRAEPSYANHQDLIDAQEAVILMWEGRYLEARKAFDALPDKNIITETHPQTNTSLSYGVQSPGQVAAAIELAIGPHAADMTTAREHANRGEWNKAITIYKKLLKEYRKPSEERDWLLRRIVLFGISQIQWDYSNMSHECISLYSYAIEADHKQLFAWLKKRKVSPHVEDIWWGTPLRFAVSEKRIDYAKELLDMGASADTTLDGKPIIYLALKNGDIPMLQLLLEHGVSPDTRVPIKNGNTLISCAIKMKKMSALPILLKYNPDLSLVDYEGFAPLAKLTKERSHQQVKLFLEHGAMYSTEKDCEALASLRHISARETIRVILGAETSPFATQACLDAFTKMIKGKKKEAELQTLFDQTTERWNTQSEHAQNTTDPANTKEESH